MSSTWTGNDAAGLGSRLSRGHTPCVLVVDLANAFTDPSHRLGADLDAVVEQTRAVIDAARLGGHLVVYTTIAFHEDLSDAGIWPQKAPLLGDLVRGTPLVEVDERLGRRLGEPVVEKQGTSAFFGTELITMLVRAHVDTVVLCGASTSGCIRATAVDCLQYGLPTLIPRGCVGDRSSEAHDANLRDLDAKYADVTSVPDVLGYLADTGSLRRTSVGDRA